VSGASSINGPLRFTRIKLSNWRNFQSANVEVQERNFLVGPNASGKSNFLDSLRFLADLVFEAGGGLDYAVRQRNGIPQIRSLAARRNPNVELEVTLGRAGHEHWRYRLVVGQDQSHHRPVVKAEAVHHDGKLVEERPDDNDRADPERLRQTHLEQVAANRSFRPVADFFRSIRYYHIVPQLVRETERWESQEVDPYGGDFLERIWQTPVRTRDSRLSRIQKALAVAVPQLDKLQVRRDQSTGIVHLEGRYKHWRPFGKWQNESEFSDGTLRLIGLLWSLLDGTGPLLLEEPELSLHSEVVRQLPQVMARLQISNRRQLIVSTHSYDLLLDKGIAADEVLLFQPTPDGTQIELSASRPEIKQLLSHGLSPAEAVIPFTKPQNIQQLTMAFD